MNKKNGMTKSASVAPFHGEWLIAGRIPPALSTSIISCNSEILENNCNIVIPSQTQYYLLIQGKCNFLLQIQLKENHPAKTSSEWMFYRREWRSSQVWCPVMPYITRTKHGYGKDKDFTAVAKNSGLRRFIKSSTPINIIASLKSINQNSELLYEVCTLQETTMISWEVTVYNCVMILLQGVENFEIQPRKLANSNSYFLILDSPLSGAH